MPAFLIAFVLELHHAPCGLRELEKARFCDSCEKYDPPIDQRGRCCGRPVLEVEVCVKTYYVCRTCKAERLSLDGCCANPDREKRTSKARTLFRCDGCGIVAARPGPCRDRECVVANREIRKTCDQSGTFPHRR
jgi:hypothetical protein